MLSPICLIQAAPVAAGSTRFSFLLVYCISLSLVVAACATHPQHDGGAPAATDTTGTPAAQSAGAPRLRIMSYNVLKYGDGCQGDAATLHGYLRSIIRYASPDIVGLVKVAAIPQPGGSDRGKAPEGFDAAIRDRALNAAYPGRYAVCPFTNKADGNNVNLLFYDRQKLGYAGMETLLTSETDFNLFRLYLRSSVAGGGRDTAFLYILLNHTESGDASDGRDAQMRDVLQALHRRFRSLPDMIDMGDFNLRNTAEPGYNALVTGDASFRFSDPPFSPDGTFRYPADWESDPVPYAAFLSTSTRKNEGEPNDCGTGGGAKFWFDHMLLSPSIAAGSGAFRYVPKSFRVIGNDGGRTGRSVNAGKHPNAAVSPELAEALFQFSNKYPVMLELEAVVH